MKLAHTLQCNIKRMTGLSRCVGMFLLLQRLIGMETGSIRKDSHNGYIVIQSLGALKSVSL